MTAAAMLLSIAARQYKLSIAAIFSIARRAVRTARLTIAAMTAARRRIGGGGNAGYQSRRQCKLSIAVIFSIAARRAHGAVNYRGGNAGYQSRRQYNLSIAAIFSIARRAVRTARFLSRRQCRLSIYPARHLFYRGAPCARRRGGVLAAAAMPVINRRHLFYRTARRAHGAVSIAAAMRYQSTQYAARQCKLSIYPARHLFYRGNDGAAMLLSIAAIFSIARRAVRTARFLSRRQCVINLSGAPSFLSRQ